MAALYILPSVLGTLLQLAHGAEHTFARWTEVGQATPRRSVVHSHDGNTHSHGPAVFILASAFAQEGSADGDEPRAAPPLILLAKAGLDPDLIAPPPVGEDAATEFLGAGSPDPGTPPLPPPQG